MLSPLSPMHSPDIIQPEGVAPLFRIALANVRFPGNLADSVEIATDAIQRAALAGAEIICFPECFVPGYRGSGKNVAPPSSDLLEQAWAKIARETAGRGIAVVLGTERLVQGSLVATELVIGVFRAGVGKL